MEALAEKNENPELPCAKVSCTGIGFRDKGKGCGRLLGITPIDVKEGSSKDWDGCTSSYYYITCPICGMRTEVFRGNFKSDFTALM